MANLVSPHGGRLLLRLVGGDERNAALGAARALPQVRLDSREVSDLIMWAMGAFSPLRGSLAGKNSAFLLVPGLK